MPKADLDALEHMEFLARQEGHAKYANLLLATITELKLARAEIAAGRACDVRRDSWYPVPELEGCKEWDVMLAARFAYDALGPAEETETKG